MLVKVKIRGDRGQAVAFLCALVSGHLSTMLPRRGVLEAGSWTSVCEQRGVRTSLAEWTHCDGKRLFEMPLLMGLGVGGKTPFFKVRLKSNGW
jgi:hypothetical protein